MSEVLPYVYSQTHNFIHSRLHKQSLSIEGYSRLQGYSRSRKSRICSKKSTILYLGGKGRSSCTPKSTLRIEYYSRFKGYSRSRKSRVCTWKGMMLYLGGEGAVVMHPLQPQHVQHLLESLEMSNTSNDAPCGHATRQMTPLAGCNTLNDAPCRLQHVK